MRVARIHADAQGESHFGDADLALEEIALFPRQPLYRAVRFGGANPAKLLIVPAAVKVHDWHTAPERQLSVAVNGAVEYETSDGEVRRFGPGELVPVEYTRGRGHITRFCEEEQCFLHIPVPDDWMTT